MTGRQAAPGDLLIGGVRVDRAAAAAFARDYLDPESTWAYLAYDDYDRDHANGPLVDTDFLAPVLLNVRMAITTYRNLLAVRKELQQGLDQLPTHGLLDATDDDIAKVADLYRVIDDRRTHGALATTLSKVLHRKRPDLIPLYDTQVRRTYMGTKDVPTGPVALGGRTRSWRQMMVEVVTAIRDDLVRERVYYEDTAAMATTPTVTALRALDITAWWAGGPRVVLAGS